MSAMSSSASARDTALAAVAVDADASSAELEVDPEYPGTAVARLRSVHARIAALAPGALDGDWPDVRRALLACGGLRDLPRARPGEGCTAHSFNDWNHCDLTAMLDDVAASENRGKVEGIAYGNQLGPGIRIASLPELGPGGSWSTCLMGCNAPEPRDVAHPQFRSRIAFKLVWAPPSFDAFVLVDDDGAPLATGTPTGDALPPLRERQKNYRAVQGSKYATAADQLGDSTAPPEQ